MVLRIKKHDMTPSSHGAKLIFLVIIWYIFSAILTGFFGIPKAIIYFGDILNLWLFIHAVYKYKARYTKFISNPIFIFMLLFMIIGLVSSAVNLEPPLMVLWGIRQNFRFFIFFFSCVMFLREKDIGILLKIVAILFWISIPLATYEALFVSYPRGTIVGDFVGGVYYGIQGVNAPLNVILLIYCTHVLLNYFEENNKFIFMITTLTAALYMSSLAELKVFLVEIVIIAVYIMICKRINTKAIIIVLLGIIALSLTISFFVQVNGKGRAYYTADYLSVSGIIENIFRESGYNGVGDLNRFTAVATMINMFFKNDMIGILLGLGLGNADYSLAFEALQSQFYQQYSWMHYQWFSISFVFIETGLLGLFCYVMIFVSAFSQGVKFIPKSSHYRGLYLAMILMMLLMIVYNPSLRNEQCGFILYFILAVPFAVCNTRREDGAYRLGVIP